MCGAMVAQPVREFVTVLWDRQIESELTNRPRQQAKQAGETAVWRSLCAAFATVSPIAVSPIASALASESENLRCHPWPDRGREQ